MATNNAVNITGSGLVKYDGAGTFSPVTVNLNDALIGAASNGISGVAPGTSGNVLTSNGTAWTSAAASGVGILTVSGSLTNSQIKNLHATPITVISAPGAGKKVVIINCEAAMVYGGTNNFGATASQFIQLSPVSTNKTLATVLTNTSIVGTVTSYNSNKGADINGVSTDFDNLAVALYNPIATEISGNAANNNTVNYFITYQIVTI